MRKKKMLSLNERAQKKVTVNSGFRVPIQLLEKFRQKVEENNSDVSKMIRAFMEDYLDECKTKK